MDDTVIVPIELDVLIFRESDTWVAQGLQYDVNAQGHTVTAALQGLQVVLAGHVQARQALGLPAFPAGMRPAPDLYHRQFARAEHRIEPQQLDSDAAHPVRNTSPLPHLPRTPPDSPRRVATSPAFSIPVETRTVRMAA